MTDVKALFIYTESAAHPGTGAGLGAVDLPIQREQTTSYPMVQGSGVKGALKSQSTANGQYADDLAVVFGPDNRQGNVIDYAGAAAFGDARILLFPVRALSGVFVWATCENVLARFVRDCRPKGTPPLFFDDAPVGSNALASSQRIMTNNKIVLEEYLYHASLMPHSGDPTRNWAAWLAENVLPLDGEEGIYGTYYRKALQNRLVILPDNDFRDFTLYATQVMTRVALDRAKKTVKQGGLFTIELLPADTVLYVPITAQRPRETSQSLSPQSEPQEVLEWLEHRCFTNGSAAPRIQMGGDETVGYGRVALRWGA